MSYLYDHRVAVDQRYPTFKKALDLLTERGGKTIVETGCIRLDSDWGAGCSTVIFADWCKTNGGHLVTIDNSHQHLEIARRIVGDLAEFVQFIESDSAEYLEKIGTPIDLLYLDSFDFPWGEMLNFYGGQNDIVAAENTLWAMSDAEVLEKHHDLIMPCQEHCRKELLAAWESLNDKSVVLIDDQNFPGGGKPRLARKELRARNWKELSELKAQQTLWVKNG